MKTNKNQSTRNQGYIAFSSLLVISAVTLAVSVSIALQGVTESQAALTFKKGREAFVAANGCAQEALIRLRNDVNYTSENLIIGDATCAITVTGVGSDRIIDIDATVSDPPDYVKHLQLVVKRTGNSINAVSWTETN